MSIPAVPPSRRLASGATAPDVTLPLQDGRTLRLADFRGQAVVLFFYPKDNTLVCTMEACHFRDAMSEFKGLEAVVIGVSEDGADSHRRFAEAHRLPFLLATDSDGTIRRAFGLKKTLGIPERVTFVIDGQGTIHAVITAALYARAHVTKALDALRRPVTPPVGS